MANCVREEDNGIEVPRTPDVRHSDGSEVPVTSPGGSQGFLLVCLCSVYFYIFVFFLDEVTVATETPHFGSGEERFGSDFLVFVQEEIQGVLARYPQLSMENGPVREALEALAQEFGGACARHKAAQQKLREKMPKPRAQQQLERLEDQLANEEAELRKESNTLKILSEEVTRLQRVCEDHRESLKDRKQQVDRTREVVAEQRELVKKSADPRLESKLEDHDVRFRESMEVLLQDRISELADDM